MVGADSQTRQRKILVVRFLIFSSTCHTKVLWISFLLKLMLMERDTMVLALVDDKICKPDRYWHVCSIL